MASPLDIYDAKSAFAASVNEVEAQAVADLQRAYARTWDRLQAGYNQLAERVLADRAAGKDIRPGDLYRMERFHALLVDTEAAYRALADEATGIADGSVGAAMDRGVEDYKAAVRALQEAGVALPEADWDVALNREAALAALGYTAEGSPLRDLFRQWGDDAFTKSRDALVSGVVAGKGTDVVARDLRGILGTNLWRSQLIARTEMHRAYREVGRQTLAHNPDVFRGWMWRAACDARTCAICWARHGTIYPSKEVMRTHPGCRCALVPVPRTFASLVGEPIPDVMKGAMKTGEQLFAKLPASRQLRVLGPGRFAQYQRGVKLRDMVTMVRRGKWGPQPRLVPLREFARSLGAGGAGPMAQGPFPVYPAWVNNAAKRRRYDRYLAQNPGAVNVPRWAVKEGAVPGTAPVRARAPRQAPVRPNPNVVAQAQAPAPGQVQPGVIIPGVGAVIGHPPIPPGARPMNAHEWQRNQARLAAGQLGLIWKPPRPGLNQIGRWGRPPTTGGGLASMTGAPRVRAAPRPAALPPVPNPVAPPRPPTAFPAIPAHGVPHPFAPGLQLLHPAVPKDGRPMNQVELERHAKRIAGGQAGLIWKPGLQPGQGHWGRPLGSARTAASAVTSHAGARGRGGVIRHGVGHPPTPVPQVTSHGGAAPSRTRLALGIRHIPGHAARIAPTFAPPPPPAPAAPAPTVHNPRTPGGRHRVLGGRAPMPGEVRNIAQERRWLRWRAENPNAPAWQRPPAAALKVGRPSTIAREPNWQKQMAAREPAWGWGQAPTQKRRRAAQQQAQRLAALPQGVQGRPGWSASAINRMANAKHPAPPAGQNLGAPGGWRPMNRAEWVRHEERLRRGQPGLIWKQNPPHWGAPPVVAAPPPPPKAPSVLEPLPKPPGATLKPGTGLKNRDSTGHSTELIDTMVPETPVSPMKLSASAVNYEPDPIVRRSLETLNVTGGNFGRTSMGGVSESYEVFLGPAGQRHAQVKPTSGQSPGIRGGSVPKYSETEREYGSYVVNRHLGYPIDHATSVIRDMGDFVDGATGRRVEFGRAVVNEWKEPKPGWKRQAYGSLADAPASEKMYCALHDALIYNLDRHGSNYFIFTETATNISHVVAIDPSLSFPVQHATGGSLPARPSCGQTNWTDKSHTLDADAKERLRVLLLDETNVRTELEPIMGANPVDNMFKRARWMWQHGRTLSTRELESGVWWNS